MLERILNEPVLVTAIVVAVGNLFGADLADLSEYITSAVAIVVGWLLRSQVTPTRKLVEPPATIQ